MKYDLHIHSKYSYDSFLRPEIILKMAKRKGLDGIAITDHNTIKGGVRAWKINNDAQKKMDVIVGSEIKTEYGDIIGLFLNEEITSQRFLEVVDEIKSQDGAIVLAHPFRHQIEFPKMLFRYIDAIEGFNARSSKSQNEIAKKLAKEQKKKLTGGSDAHSIFEIGRGYAISNKVLDGNIEAQKVFGRESNYFLSHGISYTSEIIKKIFK